MTTATDDTDVCAWMQQQAAAHHGHGGVTGMGSPAGCAARGAA